jgi:hypothetical protein
LISYHEQLDLLRDHLAERGHDTAARDLLNAERSAATFGELINNVGLILRDLAAKKLDADLKPEMESVICQGQQLWNLSNQ